MIKTILSTLTDSFLCVAFVVASLAFVTFMLCPWYLPSLFYATDGFAWLFGIICLLVSILSFNLLDLKDW